MLKIAIPQTNEFTWKSIELLRKSGVDFFADVDSNRIFRSKNFPAQIRQMNFEQIISAVATGAQDIGIVGEHHFEDNICAEIRCVYKFLSYKSNFSLFINKDVKYKGLESMMGRKIATAFPNLVGSFFKQRNIRANIFRYSQPLHLALELGVADGICILEDENTCDFQQQLRESEVIMQSSPVIIAGRRLSAPKQIILDELIDRIESVQKAEGKKMIYIAVPLDKKERVLEVLALAKYKTIVMSISDDNRFLINLIADERQLWDLKAHLKLLGAENIYVLPIENII
jgi:ATP phosphoribosyltransferase